MAEETVDRAIVEYGLKGARPCATEKIQLVGSHGWSKMMFIKLVRSFLFSLSSSANVPRSQIQQFGLEVRSLPPSFATKGPKLMKRVGRRRAASYRHVRRSRVGGLLDGGAYW